VGYPIISELKLRIISQKGNGYPSSLIHNGDEEKKRLFLSSGQSHIKKDQGSLGNQHSDYALLFDFGLSSA